MWSVLDRDYSQLVAARPGVVDYNAFVAASLSRGDQYALSYRSEEFAVGGDDDEVPGATGGGLG